MASSASPRAPAGPACAELVDGLVVVPGLAALSLAEEESDYEDIEDEEEEEEAVVDDIERSASAAAAAAAVEEDADWDALSDDGADELLGPGSDRRRQGADRSSTPGEDDEEEEEDSGDGPTASMSAEDARDAQLMAEAEAAARGEAAARAAVPVPAVLPGAFGILPPTLRFAYPGDGTVMEGLPEAVRKVLRFKVQSVTPTLVKKMVSQVSLRTNKKGPWTMTWGKHMKAEAFRALEAHQKINHFPGSFQLGRKDRLWKHISSMQARYGKRNFDFAPDTYCLPRDLPLLRRAFQSSPPKSKWILKPNASARGIGIKVIHKWEQVPKKRSVIVQKYLDKPYLINGTKFDMRVYAYVTSFDPLVVYICKDGLGRFATTKYSSNMSKLSNRYMHLTNYSINKKSDKFVANADADACEGHKWGLNALFNYLKTKHNVDVDAVWRDICDLVIKTLMSVESVINSAIKWNTKSRGICHELFGFDVMLDSSLKAWLIEVNISPSLHSNSRLDLDIKGRLMRDVFNLAGFPIPAEAAAAARRCAADSPSTLGSAAVSTPAPAPDSPWLKAAPPPAAVAELVQRVAQGQLTPEERAKHVYFNQHFADLVQRNQLQKILRQLTDDDICVLMHFDAQQRRSGDLVRIMPTPTTQAYLAYTDTPRYYNFLLFAWTAHFAAAPQRGTAYLQQIADEAIERLVRSGGVLPSPGVVLDHAHTFVVDWQVFRAPALPKLRAGSGSSDSGGPRHSASSTASASSPARRRTLSSSSTGSTTSSAAIPSTKAARLRHSHSLRTLRTAAVLDSASGSSASSPREPSSAHSRDGGSAGSSGRREVEQREAEEVEGAGRLGSGGGISTTGAVLSPGRVRPRRRLSDSGLCGDQAAVGGPAVGGPATAATAAAPPPQSLGVLTGRGRVLTDSIGNQQQSTLSSAAELLLRLREHQSKAAASPGRAERVLLRGSGSKLELAPGVGQFGRAAESSSSSPARVVTGDGLRIGGATTAAARSGATGYKASSRPRSGARNGGNPSRARVLPMLKAMGPRVAGAPTSPVRPGSGSAKGAAATMRRSDWP